MAWIAPAIMAAASLASAGASVAGAVKAGQAGDGKGGKPPYTPKSPYSWTPTAEQQATGVPLSDSEAGRKIRDLENMGKTGLASQTVVDARGQQNEMRSKYLEGLAALASRAQGQNSVVDSQAQLERDKAQRAFASQLATMTGQGYYSPAAAFAAQQQSSGLQQNLASSIAAAKSKEMQDAQDAYLKAVGAGRQQDLGLMGQELAQEEARQRFYAGMAGLGQGYAGLDLQNKLAQQSGAAGMEMNRGSLELQAALGESGQQLTRDLANQNLYTNLGMGSLGAGSGALQAYLQSRGTQPAQPSQPNTASGLIDPWKP